VVDAALENDLSGTSHKWRQGLRPVTVRVTPLKTYRDKEGVYDREYRLEVKRNDQTVYVNGLAYRESNGTWVIPHRLNGLTKLNRLKDLFSLRR
jgi:surface antigen